MTQEKMILEYLKQGNSLTALECLEKMNCMRLASRVSDLRKDGYEIISERVELPSGKRIAKYRLKTLEEICERHTLPT